MGRSWAVDLTADSTALALRAELPTPPGYSELHAHDQESRIDKKKVDHTQLKLKKAKELAFQPIKSFFMTGFMLWMSGNGVHIFSIMITVYAIYNPIKSAMGVNAVFARFNDAKMTSLDRTSLLSSKALYVLLNMVAMMGALYKMSLMGLLPTTPADWVSFLAVPPAVQFASGAQTSSSVSL